MQVALWSVGGSAGRARRVADELVADGVAGLQATEVVVLAERPPSAVPALVRGCDLVVVLVGAGAAGDLDRADEVVAAAAAARHVAVLGGAGEHLDEPAERWLSRLAGEHRVSGPAAVATSVAAMVAWRRRCLANPVTQPDVHDRANEPREGRTLDEVALGEPQPRVGPAGEGGSGGGLDRAAADEQWNEAVQAWRLQLWPPAIEHLQRALALRPLDPEVGLWLARGLAASQSTSGRSEAALLAAAAARIAEQKGRVHWAAAAWLWVARLDRSDDPAAALLAADRAAALVPHRAEPWTERALVHVGTGDAVGATEATLAAYRHHERALAALVLDPFSPRDPEEAIALVDDVRQETVDRLIKLMQLAERVAAGAAGTSPPTGPPPHTEPIGPPPPIGAAASDELVALSLPELADRGRELAAEVRAALLEWASHLAGEVRAPSAGPGRGGRAAHDWPVPDDGPSGRHAIRDAESLVWGLAGAGAVALCGLGLWWATGAVLWALGALLVVVVALVLTYRAATDPTAGSAAGFADESPEPSPAAPRGSPGAPPPVPDGDPGPSGPPDPLERWRLSLQALGYSIDLAESLTLDWPRLGPAVPAYRARLGELVVLGAVNTAGTVDNSTGPASVRSRLDDVDDQWLPPDLRRLAEPLPVSEASPSGRLYRLLPAEATSPSASRSGPATTTTPSPDPAAAAGPSQGPSPPRLPGRAVRWAAYFDPLPASARDLGPPA